jgi:hypothetical protein
MQRLQAGRPGCGDGWNDLPNALWKGKKMKSSTTLLLVIAAACCTLPFVLGSADVTKTPPEVGRFVLESGEYLAPSHAAERRVPGIFKIDTATGKVWRYTARVTGKQTVEEWVLIPE